MNMINEIVGKRVIDASAEDLGVIESLILVFRLHGLYMTVRGDGIVKFRGNDSELIPVNEIEVITSSVHLLKTFEDLKEAITSVNISSSDVVRVNGLIGMSAMCSDGQVVGNITNIALSEERMELYLILEGPNIKKMRGHTKEAISLKEVGSIENYVKFELPYSALVEQILMRQTYLK